MEKLRKERDSVDEFSSNEGPRSGIDEKWSKWYCMMYILIHEGYCGDNKLSKIVENGSQDNSILTQQMNIGESDW